MLGFKMGFTCLLAKDLDSRIFVGWQVIVRWLRYLIVSSNR
jgi:hypothetical protein